MALTSRFRSPHKIVEFPEAVVAETPRPYRSYLGIDGGRHREWAVVLRAEGKIGFSGSFKHTSDDLLSLVRFIAEYCWRPKICLKPGPLPMAELLGLLGTLPDAEVILLSEPGFRMHRSWLPSATENPSETTGRAAILARCAERMI